MFRLIISPRQFDAKLGVVTDYSKSGELSHNSENLIFFERVTMFRIVN